MGREFVYECVIFRSNVLLFRPCNRAFEFSGRGSECKQIFEVPVPGVGLVGRCFDFEEYQVQSTRDSHVERRKLPPRNAFQKPGRQTNVPLPSRSTVEPPRRQVKILGDLPDSGIERRRERIRRTPQRVVTIWALGERYDVNISSRSLDDTQQMQGCSADYDDTRRLTLLSE